MPRPLKYPFDKMTVGGDPIVRDIANCSTMQQCAINWAFLNNKPWKFKSKRDRKNNIITLWRIK